MLEKNLNCPATTSMGRLFDGIAALLGLCDCNTFEGQAAMALEFAADRGFSPSGNGSGSKAPLLQASPHETTTLTERNSTITRLDWHPLLQRLLPLAKKGKTEAAAAMFHENIVSIASNEIHKHATSRNINQILLSGGCFQNKTLTELLIASLRGKGLIPYTHHQIPPNDGGIAVGQAVGAIQQYKATRQRTRQH